MFTQRSFSTLLAAPGDLRTGMDEDLSLLAAARRPSGSEHLGRAAHNHAPFGRPEHRDRHPGVARQILELAGIRLGLEAETVTLEPHHDGRCVRRPVRADRGQHPRGALQPLSFPAFELRRLLDGYSSSEPVFSPSRFSMSSFRLAPSVYLPCFWSSVSHCSRRSGVASSSGVPRLNPSAPSGPAMLPPPFRHVPLRRRSPMPASASSTSMYPSHAPTHERLHRGSDPAAAKRSARRRSAASSSSGGSGPVTQESRRSARAGLRASTGPCR